MKLLTVYSPEVHVSDISWAFVEKGHQVVQFDEWITYIIPDKSEIQRLYEKLSKSIKSNGIEACFTWNYSPLLSDVCEEMGIPYLSWSFDSPILHIFAKNMFNNCNYFFIFDKKFYEELKSYHLPHVFYLPLAINSLRLSSLVITDEEIEHYKRDLSFVGNLYHNNLYDEWLKILPKDITNQVEDIFCRQFNNWEENFIYKELDNGLLDRLQARITMGVFAEKYPNISPKLVYGGFALARKYAQIERICMLDELSQHFPVTLYTDSDSSKIPKVENRSSVDYETQMPIVFYASKINLNISLRSIETGIPLRVFDIMGSAGFAITNTQEELYDYFEPNKDLVIYHSIEELEDQISYYLSHEKERVRILANGYKKVHAEHTYVQRVEKMMEALK